jgi:flagellar hook-associated protein 1 FlgK
VGIFIGGSQALVLGNTAASLSLTADDFGVQNNKLALTRNGVSTTLNENTLGGGEVPALLRFQNTDMAEARNLLGRYSLAVTTSMNDQHKLGLDLDGNVGGNLFTPIDISKNISEPIAPATSNTGIHATDVTLAISDITKFVASDYEMNFSGPAVGTVTPGTIIRRSDGVATAFQYDSATGSFSFFNAATSAYDLTAIDGLSMSATTLPTPTAGDRLLIKPFSTSANNISAEFSSPRALAVASPVVGKMGSTNTGSLQLTQLTTRTNPPLVETAASPLTLKFTSANQYIRSDDLNYNNYPLGVPLPTAYNYTSGSPIEGTEPATTPLSEWSLVLQGAPKAGDTFTVTAMKDMLHNNGIDLKLNAGNASAMMNLRDVATFDGASLTDGYAGLIAQIGIRSQSASYTAGVSSAIAATLEKDRTAVSGVNLDEEAAKLLQYQQAYQASAKVIQIAQGIFDTLIQTMSR